jgi:hypothetical protein
LASNDLRVGDVGVNIIFIVKQNSVAQDISAGTTTLTFTKPNGVTVNKPSTFVTDGTDGKVKYTTEEGFLDCGGVWRVIGLTDIGSATYTSEIAEFNVQGVEESWQLHMRLLLRSLIADTVEPYTYHDDALDQLLVNAACFVDMEVDFINTYTINNAKRLITPDPVTTGDHPFCILTAYKAAFLIYQQEAKLAAQKGVKVKDGPSEIDYRDAASRAKAMLGQAERNYNKALVAYKTGDGMRGHGIVTPFHDSSLVADQDRR